MRNVESSINLCYYDLGIYEPGYNFHTFSYHVLAYLFMQSICFVSKVAYFFVMFHGIYCKQEVPLEQKVRLRSGKNIFCLLEKTST